jgi:hypothetical protein
MKEWDGTFELIDPHDIQFDRSKYQRSEQWPLIGRVAANPRWESFVVIPCAKRVYAGGTLFAYDGQQRLLGMLASSDPPKTVPVVWWPVGSRAEEAAIFTDVNVNRVAVTALGKFKAQIGAENPAHIAIAKVVEECDYSLGMNGATAKAIGSVGGLQVLYNETGELGVRVALEAIDEAWADERMATTASMLRLLSTVLGEMASNGGIKKDKLVASMRRTTPGRIMRKAKDIRYETDCSAAVSQRRAFKALAKL